MVGETNWKSDFKKRSQLTEIKIGFNEENVVMEKKCQQVRRGVHRCKMILLGLVKEQSKNKR